MLTSLVFLLAPASALLLSSRNLTVEVDDIFPRPLSYSFGPTGENITGSLTDWGFHLSLSLNSGQLTCPEAAIITKYNTSSGASSSGYLVSAACVLNWVRAVVTSFAPLPHLVFVKICALSLNENVLLPGSPPVDAAFALPLSPTQD